MALKVLFNRFVDLTSPIQILTTWLQVDCFDSGLPVINHAVIQYNGTVVFIKTSNDSSTQKLDH